MAETTGISWCDSTFNPWRGCQKVSPGCKHCYAETLTNRWGGDFAHKRVVAAESYWRQPLKWDREAKAAGQRRRVFCASLADVFEDWNGSMANAQGHTLYRGDSPDDWHNEGPPYERLTIHDVRRRLFALIDQTPNLDWLLLTKRPENVVPCLDAISNGQGDAWNLRDHMPSVWLGVSVEDRQRTARIDILRQTPAAIRFLSVEPLLEDVGALDLTGIHWVIVGG